MREAASVSHEAKPAGTPWAPDLKSYSFEGNGRRERG